MSQETMNSHVEYRPIPGFDEWRYRIGKDVSVWYKQWPKSQWRRSYIEISNGHLFVRLTDQSGKRLRRALGRLMLMAFKPGTRSLGDRVYFGNKGPLCCELSNLSWESPNASMIGRSNIKRLSPDQLRGELNPNAVLSTTMVLEARRLRRDGWLVQELADEFGISQSQMSRVLNGTRWSHVPDPPPVAHTRSEISEAD